MNKKILAISSCIALVVLLTLYRGDFTTKSENSINATKSYLGSWVHSKDICSYKLSIEDLHEVTFAKGIETFRAGIIDVDNPMVFDRPLLPSDLEQYRTSIEQLLVTCPKFNLDFETATEITVSRPSSTLKFIYFRDPDILLNVTEGLPTPQLLLSSRYINSFEILD